MKLVRSFNIPYNNTLREWMKVSNNLYNQALYEQKQYYKQHKKDMSYSELDKHMKQVCNLENEINYKLLPSQVSQQILKLLNKNIKSYKALLEMYFEDLSSLSGRPKFPKYKTKGGLDLLIFANQNSNIDLVNRTIKLYNPSYKNALKLNMPIVIPEGVFTMDFKDYNQIRFIPKHSHIKVEIIYEINAINEELNPELYASIDLGIDNLITLVSNMKGLRPLIINGRPIKSYNQFYNKIKSKLQSIKDKMDIKGFTNNLYKLEEDRYNYIHNMFHQISRYIIRYLIKHKIANLVIGKNDGWKQNVNLGKKNNQNFVQIPFNKLLSMIEYKANLAGIKVIY